MCSYDAYGSRSTDCLLHRSVRLCRCSCSCSFSAKDPTAWKLFDSCLELLKSKMESREFDKEVCDAHTFDNRGHNLRGFKELQDMSRFIFCM